MNLTALTRQSIEAFDQSGASPPQRAGVALLATPASQPLSVLLSNTHNILPPPLTAVVGNQRWAAPLDAALGRVVLAVPAHELLGAAVCLKPCDVERVFADGESESFLHVRAAASRAGVHEETLRRAYRNNQLAAQRVGVRGIRIHPVELKDWMADGMPTRPKPSPSNRPALEGGA